MVGAIRQYVAGEPQKGLVVDQVFRLVECGGLSLNYRDNKVEVIVKIVRPDGSMAFEVGEGETDVAAARKAVEKAVAPMLNLEGLHILKTGIKRERRAVPVPVNEVRAVLPRIRKTHRSGELEDADTCYWVTAMIGQSREFKGHSRHKFTTRAFVEALLIICTRIHQLAQQRQALAQTLQEQAAEAITEAEELVGIKAPAEAVFAGPRHA